MAGSQGGRTVSLGTMGDAPRADEHENWRKLVRAGADIAGAATGAGVGQLVGGTMGAAAGGAYGATASVMFKDAALDFAYRLLGKREEERVGAVIRYFWEKYRDNLDAGEHPRQDGFFDDAPDDRAGAKEVFEGVLLAAQREHQEKKLRFFGNLVANLAFRPEYDRAHANHLIKVAEDLSFQQLCILSLAGSENGLRVAPEQEEEHKGQRPTRVAKVGLMAEMHDLSQRQMLTTGTGDSVEFEISTIVPMELSVDNAGTSLYSLMELASMDGQDLARITRLLR